MSVSLAASVGAFYQSFLRGGNPNNGGTIDTFLSGTTTPAPTFTSASGAIANSNPIVLGADGRVPFEIFLTDGIGYSFVLKDFLGNTIKTQDDIVGIGSGGSALSAALAAPGGSALVGFLQAGAGSVARTAQDKMRDFLNVKDKGGICNGVADDTAALQAAIADVKQKPRPIYIPGFCRVTAPIVYQTNGSSSGLCLIGDSRESSGIIGDFAGDTLIDIDGSSLNVGTFQYGGGFRDMTLKTSPTAVIKRAITTNGWWFPEHRNVAIGTLGVPNFTEYGIYIPLRADISANPDFYASIGWTLNDVQIDSVGLSGIYGANNTGYSDWKIKGGSYSRCGRDGLEVHTNAWLVESAALSYNGRYGLNYSGEVGATLTSGMFATLELDGNATAGMFINRVLSGQFDNLRFISRVLNAAETQLTHVLCDSSGVCTNLLLTNSYHRIEAGITSAVNLYDGGVASINVSGNTIKGYSLLNTAGVTVTDVVGSFARKDFRNAVSRSGGKYVNAAYPKFTHSSLSNQAITAVLSTWVFNVAVEATGWTDYNTATGVLTAPHNGMYLFNVSANVSTIPNDEQFIINILKNGGIVKTAYFDWPAGAGADRWRIGMTEVVSVAAGDLFSIEVKNSTGTATLFGAANLDIVCL